MRTAAASWVPLCQQMQLSSVERWETCLAWSSRTWLAWRQVRAGRAPVVKLWGEGVETSHYVPTWRSVAKCRLTLSACFACLACNFMPVAGLVVAAHGDQVVVGHAMQCSAFSKPSLIGA